MANRFPSGCSTTPTSAGTEIRWVGLSDPSAYRRHNSISTGTLKTLAATADCPC